MYGKSRFTSLFLVAGIIIICCLAGCKKKGTSLKLNEPRNIRGVINYKRSFGGLNEKHLKVAQTVGIRPLAPRKEVEKLKEKLQHIAVNDSYAVDSLACSIPYLILGAAASLDTIGYNFLDSLTAKGLNPNRTTVTPVLRTKDGVKRPRRRNANASENSVHSYGTILDVSRKRFQKIEDENGYPLQDMSSDALKLMLSKVPRDLEEADKCYVKCEPKQDCFHITTRM